MTGSSPLSSFYASGAQALAINKDGTGFAYYPSGRVALCISAIGDKKRYYLYSDEPKATLFGAIDEHGTGFFIDCSRGPQHGTRLVLNKRGGLLSDGTGYIVGEWRWEASNRRSLPPELSVTMNKVLSLEFRDRTDIRAKFSIEGISHSVDMGLKPSREGTYLDNSVRLAGGRLEPQLDHQTLVSRQESFGSEMKAKRDHLKPRSCNLGGDIKAIVASLEAGFDGMVETFQDPAWKGEARAKTVGELPRIRCTGLEVGPTPGLGSYISFGGEDPVRASRQRQGGRGLRRGIHDVSSSETCGTVARFRKGGKWLGDLDVRRQLLEENPLLMRSLPLQKASGRYAEEIMIPGGVPSPINPTGKTEESGRRLQNVPPSRQAALRAAATAGPEQLVVACCIRSDDPPSRKVERVAEIVNGFLHQSVTGGEMASGSGNGAGGGGTGTGMEARRSGRAGQELAPPQTASCPFLVVRVDMCESQAAADRLGVKSIPTFLMFRRGRCVWAGSLGGRPVKAAPAERSGGVGVGGGECRVLLVEPEAKAQVAAERVLRKHGCSWDLYLVIQYLVIQYLVVQYFSLFSTYNNPRKNQDGYGYGIVLVSDCLGASEVAAIEKVFRGPGGGTPGGGSPGTPLLVGLVSVHGRTPLSHLPKAFLSTGYASGSGSGSNVGGVLLGQVLPPHLAMAVDAAATKPLRATALKRILSTRAEAVRQGMTTTAGAGGTRNLGSSVGGMLSEHLRYKGVTPSKLLERMEIALIEARASMPRSDKLPVGMGKAIGGGGKSRTTSGPGIVLSAQETFFKGKALQRSTLQQGVQ
ncbi:unnamed protein product [Discosporangium mesarthrocarpum]